MAGGCDACCGQSATDGDWDGLRAARPRTSPRMPLPGFSLPSATARLISGRSRCDLVTEIVGRMAELGFMGMAIPTEHGGSGLDNVSYALVVEEVSRACASCGVVMSVNNTLFCARVNKFRQDWRASPDQFHGK